MLWNHITKKVYTLQQLSKGSNRTKKPSQTYSVVLHMDERTRNESAQGVDDWWWSRRAHVWRCGLVLKWMGSFQFPIEVSKSRTHVNRIFVTLTEYLWHLPTHKNNHRLLQIDSFEKKKQSIAISSVTTANVSKKCITQQFLSWQQQHFSER